MVALIGAGMGEDGLLSLKARDFLAKADAVIYDRLIDHSILLYCRPQALFIRAGKSSTDGGHQQGEINNILVSYGKRYKTVARLHGGDPFVFGRGGEELNFLRESDIPVEIIPGISSIYAAGAYAGIPITHREFNSSVHVYTAHKSKEKARLDFKQISTLPGTLVFLMGSKSIALIADSLMREGKSPQTPLAIVYSAATPHQKEVFGTLAEASVIMEREKFHAPVAILIGEGACSPYIWYRKPLFNLLCVGERASLGRLAKRLEGKSYRTLFLPMIETHLHNLKLNPQLVKLCKCALFTSPNAVRFSALNLPFHLWGDIALGAVGSATAESLKKYGLHADIITHSGAHALIEAAVSATKDHDKIIVFTSAENTLNTAELSRLHCREFIIAPVYTSSPVPWAQEPVADVLAMAHILAFTSGKGVEYFFNSLQGEIPDIPVCALGESARKALAARGISPIFPDTPRYDAMISCIERHMNVPKI